MLDIVWAIFLAPVWSHHPNKTTKKHPYTRMLFRVYRLNYALRFLPSQPLPVQISASVLSIVFTSDTSHASPEPLK